MAVQSSQAGQEGAAPPSAHLATHKPMAEINVTPFVDVMLVLLIIFMVSAPLLVSGIELELPEGNEAPLSPQQDPLTISITEEAVFVQDVEVAWEELAEHFARLAENDAEQRIYVRGGKAISYGRVMAVIGALQDAGLNRIGLVSLPPSEQAAQ